jgi:hypothetical protein
LMEASFLFGKYSIWSLFQLSAAYLISIYTSALIYVVTSLAVAVGIETKRVVKPTREKIGRSMGKTDIITKLTLLKFSSSYVFPKFCLELAWDQKSACFFKFKEQPLFLQTAAKSYWRITPKSLLRCSNAIKISL